MRRKVVAVGIQCKTIQVRGSHRATGFPAYSLPGPENPILLRAEISLVLVVGVGWEHTQGSFSFCPTLWKRHQVSALG